MSATHSRFPGRQSPKNSAALVQGDLRVRGHIVELYAVSAEDVLFIEWLPAQPAVRFAADFRGQLIKIAAN